MIKYLDCLRTNGSVSTPCRVLGKDYLGCRMNRYAWVLSGLGTGGLTDFAGVSWSMMIGKTLGWGTFIPRKTRRRRIRRTLDSLIRNNW